MSQPRQTELAGSRGRIVLHEWPSEHPRYIALIAHGYGEHAARYGHVADHLVRHGGAVYAPDHLGHGRSEGERALIERADDMVEDLEAAARKAGDNHPELPVVLIGHSMGGIVAARFAQRHASQIAGLVLSGPAIGGSAAIEALLAMDRIPDVLVDPSTLSRDPEVGRAYAEDPLVWHGPFRRATLEAMVAAVRAIAAGPSLALPTLWLHGEDDALVPVADTRPAVERLAGARLESVIYPGARHEVLNETNRDEVLADLTSFIDRALTGRG
jgi:alpha-beta hydrolase superfamily lysophospholipase